MSKILPGNSFDVVIKLNNDEVIKICGENFEAFDRQRNFLLKTNIEQFIKINNINKNCYSMKYYPTSLIDKIYNNEYQFYFYKLLDCIEKIHEENVGNVDYDSYIIKIEERIQTKLSKGYVPKNGDGIYNKWGIVHGDLTFSNILINEYDEFVFIDPRGTEEADYYDFGKIMQSLILYYEIKLNNKYNTPVIKNSYDKMAEYMFKNYDEELLLFYLAVHLLGAVPFLKSKNRSYVNDFYDKGMDIFKRLGINKI